MSTQIIALRIVARRRRIKARKVLAEITQGQAELRLAERNLFATIIAQVVAPTPRPHFAPPQFERVEAPELPEYPALPDFWPRMQ